MTCAVLLLSVVLECLATCEAAKPLSLLDTTEPREQQHQLALDAAPMPEATLLDFDYAGIKQAWAGCRVDRNGTVVPANGKNRKDRLEGWDIGRGIADLLSGELARMAPGIRLRRQLPGQTSRLVAADVPAGATPTAAVPLEEPGQPRFLLVGSIMRFGGESSFPGASDSEGWAAAANTAMSVFRMMRDRGHVDLSVRIVEASNGEILKSLRVQAQSVRRGTLLGGLKTKKDEAAQDVIDMTSPDFQKTVLGEATLLAVRDLAQQLFASLKSLGG